MSMDTYKRPKEIHSKTENIKLECGTLNLIFGYQEEVEGKVIEVRALIGKSGICPAILLDSFSKTLSVLLQSPMPRYKIVEKIKKQFVGVTCSQGVSCCVNEIAVRLLKELE